MIDNKKGRNYNLDIMKFILSIFVVLIHAEVDIHILTPFLRMAVPLFFITSSYFFFRNFHLSNDRKKTMQIFLKRNMILYGIWFVILLPVTLPARDWFDSGIMSGMVLLLQSFFFNSTFRASWYLMALNIGMCLSVLLVRKLTPRVQLFLTLPIYLLCCLFTNYYGVAELSGDLMVGYNTYIFVFISLANSFPVALFWIACGRLFAENKEGSLKHRGLLVLISSVLLIAEHLIVSRLGLQKGNDCYIMLIPICYLVFEWVLHTKPLELKSHSGLIRAMVTRSGNISTLIYVSHASVISVLFSVAEDIMKTEFYGLEWCVCFITMIACLSLCAIVFVLERQKTLRWLKYLY